jgi:nucleotide-binding universal stress UspA family protein
MTVQTEATPATIFDRIVCGVDGTQEALTAARQAEQLRSPEGTLRLVAVEDVSAAVHGGFAMSHLLEELDTTARDGLRRTADEVKPTSEQLLAGEPSHLLLAEIERTRATLVALGPRGHSQAMGMLLGGVATELLHRAPCSVLLAREPNPVLLAREPNPEFGEFPSSIIVGVDGSEQSLAAWAVARSVAERFGAELVTVSARGGKGSDVRKVEELDPDAIFDPGTPVEALVGLSKEADLLVVGSRGMHGPRALGSVSERVGHRAPCSVLVVR